MWPVNQEDAVSIAITFGDSWDADLTNSFMGDTGTLSGAQELSDFYKTNASRWFSASIATYINTVCKANLYVDCFGNVSDVYRDNFLDAMKEALEESYVLNNRLRAFKPSVGRTHSVVFSILENELGPPILGVVEGMPSTATSPSSCPSSLAGTARTYT